MCLLLDILISGQELQQFNKLKLTSQLITKPEY